MTAFAFGDRVWYTDSTTGLRWHCAVVAVDPHDEVRTYMLVRADADDVFWCSPSTLEPDPITTPFTKHTRAHPISATKVIADQQRGVIWRASQAQKGKYIIVLEDRSGRADRTVTLPPSRFTPVLAYEGGRVRVFGREIAV